MKNVFIAMMMLFALVSCVSEKDKYVDRYDRFAKHVLTNGETFTSLDWEAAVTEYETLRNEYHYYSCEMTNEERQRIEELNEQINARIIEHSADNAIETFKSVLNEIVGTIDELSK